MRAAPKLVSALQLRQLRQVWQVWQCSSCCRCGKCGSAAGAAQCSRPASSLHRPTHISIRLSFSAVHDSGSVPLRLLFSRFLRPCGQQASVRGTSGAARRHQGGTRQQHNPPATCVAGQCTTCHSTCMHLGKGRACVLCNRQCRQLSLRCHSGAGARPAGATVVPGARPAGATVVPGPGLQVRSRVLQRGEVAPALRYAASQGGVTEPSAGSGAAGAGVIGRSWRRKQNEADAHSAWVLLRLGLLLLQVKRQAARLLFTAVARCG